jgi:hypothetical protein
MKSLAALTVALASVFAAVAAPPESPMTAIGVEGQAPATKVEVLNGIELMNGGVNISDANYLKSRAYEFPLQFIFSGRGGEYGVAEKLTLRSGGREVVTVMDAGPYVMFKVPPGSYTAEATFKGTVERRTVVVGNSVSKVSWNTLRASE